MPGLTRLGLTGGIGSGKSTVAQMLADRGAAIVDADAIARSMTAPNGQAIAAIAKEFGPRFIAADGALDRHLMRTLAFDDPTARRRLEAIIHPLVGQEATRQADDAVAAGARVLVFDIPLLAESTHWRERLDRVMVIDCPEDTQVARVTARDGLPPATVQAIIAAQAPRLKRLAAADGVICNDTLTLDALRAIVGQVARDFGL
ncbi:MAG: dephospho-CoA kinase [Burkholderiales bacterium]|nr:dephospho-CoA kinase [Burkholderiales bacterium]